MELGDNIPKSPITVSVKSEKSLETCKPSSSKDNSEITMDQFLHFLKTAYQVNDNLEGILLQEGMTEVVDWLKLKNSSLVSCNFDGASASPEENQSDVSIKKSEESLQAKLNEILNEGLLDSVLPHIVPPTSAASTTTTPNRKSKEKVVHSSSCNDIAGASRRKSSHGNITKVIKTNSEVEIHVFDELKGLKKDFVCNQKILVEQMGYFADVTRDQKLDDMDISVHCDINIFDWLMRWVKRHQALEPDHPTLEPPSAIPILVSASFLQMEPLLQECLFYCHRNMNDILKTSASLSCLNDSILTRLGAMYTNVEVENIRDRKDKIQSRLFCKLIQSLCEIEPEAVRGHYNSLARIFRCKHCQQLVSPPYSPDIPCVPSCMYLDYDGSVKSRHVRDPAWNLNDFIVGLHKSLKTWRKVYWRLWGCAHFLYCLTCKRFFPARHEGWCRYHPDHPQFFTMDTQKPPLPIGRYPCCGERTYRFQLLEDRSGCHCRDHTICTKDIRDASVAGLLDNYRSLIAEEPPHLVFPDRLTRLVAREPSEVDDGRLDSKEVLWWEGLEIVPARPRLGLLGAALDAPKSSNTSGETADEFEEEEEDSPHWSDTEESESSRTSSSLRSTESSSTPERKNKKNTKKKSNKKKLDKKLWQHNLSARSNQDMQRANEEIVFKRMMGVLNNKTMNGSVESTATNKSAGSKIFPRHVVPTGGIWVRLEAEWKEKNGAAASKNKNIYTGKVKMKTSRLI